jgi:peptidyl-tRNA hydrolase, PTH2 family
MEMSDEPKMVIVARKDLNMRKGKLAAQCSHAAMKIILDLMTKCNPYPYDSIYWTKREFTLKDTDPLDKWLKGRFTKVVVSVDSEQELLDIKAKADAAGIRTALITDAGLTEFHGIPTNTCVAIGPDYPDKLDPITGTLKLL